MKQEIKIYSALHVFNHTCTCILTKKPALVFSNSSYFPTLAKNIQAQVWIVIWQKMNNRHVNLNQLDTVRHSLCTIAVLLSIAFELKISSIFVLFLIQSCHDPQVHILNYYPFSVLWSKIILNYTLNVTVCLWARRCLIETVLQYRYNSTVYR